MMLLMELQKQISSLSSVLSTFGRYTTKLHVKPFQMPLSPVLVTFRTFSQIDYFQFVLWFWVTSRVLKWLVFIVLCVFLLFQKESKCTKVLTPPFRRSVPRTCMPEHSMLLQLTLTFIDRALPRCLLGHFSSLLLTFFLVYISVVLKWPSTLSVVLKCPAHSLLSPNVESKVNSVSVYQ